MNFQGVVGLYCINFYPSFALKKIVKKETNMIVDTSSLNEKIYQLLRDRIVFGDYAPGSRVEVKKLKEELNVSPQPVKEAIFRLAGEGFITIFPRKGTYVREANLKDLIDMVEARTFYETSAIELAIGQITSKDLNRLEGLCEDILDKEDTSYKAIQRRNMAFHCAVVGLSKNQWLYDAYKLMMAHYASLHFRYVVTQKDYADPEQIYKEHKTIINALGLDNVEEAKNVVKGHMECIKIKIEKVLFSGKSELMEER